MFQQAAKKGNKDAFKVLEEKYRESNYIVKRNEIKTEQSVYSQNSYPRLIVAGNAISVFFDKNSAIIDDEKDLVNLQAVAATVKASDAKVVVTGFAHSDENITLSAERADCVAKQLIEYGVPA